VRGVWIAERIGTRKPRNHAEGAKGVSRFPRDFAHFVVRCLTALEAEIDRLVVGLYGLAEVFELTYRLEHQTRALLRANSAIIGQKGVYLFGGTTWKEL